MIDSKVCCTGSVIGKVLFESSMTDWEAKYMFNISALSYSFSAYLSCSRLKKVLCPAFQSILV